MRHLLLLILFFGFQAFAGNGWVSSGGDLYRSDKNPWFLRNTKTVNYCVSVDPKGISIPADEVRKHVKGAIDYWKNEFYFVASQSAQKKPANGTLNAVGSQNFVEGVCDKSTDLQFVIGAGSLSPEQRASISNVRRTLGRTTRTSYDFEQLRGRGFIFVASDTGPERFARIADSAKFWSKKNTLMAILAHELGHVFGLPHFGGGLMAESFAEKLTMPLAPLFLNLDKLPPVLRAKDVSQTCSVDKELLNWLGFQDAKIPVKGPSTFCLTLAISNDPNSDPAKPALFKLSVYEEASPQNPTELGRVVLSKLTKPDEFDFPLDMNINISSVIFIDSRQKVFQDDELLRLPDPNDGSKTVVTDFLFGTGEIKYGQRAELLMKDGSAKNIYIHSEPAGYKIHAEVNGKTRLIFNSDSLFMM